MKLIDKIPGYNTDQPLRRRVNDEAYQKFTTQELDRRKSLYVKLNQIQTKFDVPNRFLDALQHTNVIQDTKLWIDLLTEKTNAVELALANHIQKTGEEFKSVYNNIDSVSNLLDTLEITNQEGWNKVVCNTFNSSFDLELGAGNYLWRTDPKTGRVFQDVDLINPKANIGLSLPVASEKKLFIKAIELVDELSSSGDALALTGNSPNELINNKPFVYSVIKLHKDSTGQIQNTKQVAFSLLVTLGGRETVNSLNIVPAAFSPLSIESVKYLKEDGDFESVSYLNDVDSSLNLNFIFNPVITNQFEIKFLVKNPIGTGSYTLGDRVLIELNKMFQNLGFQTRYHVDTIDAVGDVFQFGINSISFQHVKYSNAGLFRGMGIPVKALKAIGCDRSLMQNRTYDSESNEWSTSLPEPAHWVEHYIGCELKDNLGIAVHELVPVPNNSGNQTEIIPIENNVGKLKLVPDLFWKQILNNVISATYTEERGPTTIGYWIVKTEFAHNYSVGDNPKFLGRADINIPNDLLVTAVPSATEFKIMVRNGATDMAASLAEGYLPRLQVYTYNDELGLVVTDTEENNLVFGEDFELSLDAGNTWLNDVPACQAWQQNYAAAKAGDCLIRLKNNLTHNNIHVSYQPQNIQQLDSRGIFWYKNNIVYLSKPLTGTIYPVFIFRSRQLVNDNYETDYYHKYVIKLRESDVL